MTIIWCMVTEIWRAIDKIFGHSGPFFSFFSSYRHRKSKFSKYEKITWISFYKCVSWRIVIGMMYGCWYMECKGHNFLSFWTVFYPLYPLSHPLTTRKIKILKKWKNHLEILSFYTCIPQMTIIWCMVPEIWSVSDRTFCYFGPLFVLLPPPPPPPSNPINQNLEKMKKIPGGLIILHKCTINDSYMMYGFWDMKCDGQSYFGPFFLPYYPRNNPKNQIF